jgi:hypothetical protein
MYENRKKFLTSGAGPGAGSGKFTYNFHVNYVLYIQWNKNKPADTLQYHKIGLRLSLQ